MEDEDPQSDDSGVNEEDVDIVEYIDEDQMVDEDEAVLQEDDDDDDDEDDDGNAEAITDDADLVFSGHTGSVFCCHLDPSSSNLVVSGGQDDRALVWSTSDGETLFECTDHKDSVTCCGFSPDGRMVATGDMSGVIQVWSVKDKCKIWSVETSDLSWLQWHGGDPRVLFAGMTDGDFWMWRMPDGDCHVFSGHGAGNECASLMPDGKRLVAGYADGAVRIWDLKTRSTLHAIRGEGVAHGDGVTCIDCYGDDTLVVTGSLDCTVKLINATNGKVLRTLNCSSQEDTATTNSVEAVGFCSSLPVFATGTRRGQLDIWDVPTQVRRQQCTQEGGIVRLVWDREAPLVYTAGTDGVLRVWDARTANVTSQWIGHSDGILDAVLSRDGNTIVTASDDKTCRLFSINKLDR